MSSNIKKNRAFILTVLVGAIFGCFAGHAIGLSSSNKAPDGWSKGEAGVPFRRADLMGELPETSGAWSIDHFQAITSDLTTQELSATFHIPTGGEVRVFPAATPPGRLRRNGGGHSTISRGEPTGAAIVLRRSLGGAAYGASIHPVSEGNLNCRGAIPTPTADPYRLSILRTPNGFTATVDDSSLECQTQFRDLPPAIQSGLQRVHITDIRTSNGNHSSPRSHLILALFAIIGGIISGAIMKLERHLGANQALCALTSLPLLFAWPLSELNGLALIEQIRAPTISPYTFFVTGPLSVTLFAKGLHHSARIGRNTLLRSRRGVFSVSLMAVVSLIWVVGIGATHIGVIAYTALYGLTLGALAWVNSNSQTLRFFNIISIALFACSVVFAESALRFSETGSGWSPRGRMSYDESLGWTRSTLSDFEALDQGEHTDYPSEGYPVGFTTTTKQRVVCLGSSATGGAFQNDDISEFYPARLAESLGEEFDVINQGVGGWTSFHMAHYFVSKAAELAPDIVTVYAGHNDLLTKSTAPYRELYSAWSANSLTSGPSILDSVLLYQGLRFVVGAMISPEGAIAVPVEHARDNLVQIIDAAENQGAAVILMTEAISPDSGPMTGYSNMMIEIAESYENVSYLEIPAMVLARGSSMFLDDVHLTDAGHRTVAGEISNHIRGSIDNQQ